MTRSGPSLARANRPSPQRAIVLPRTVWARLEELQARSGLHRSEVIRALLAADLDTLLRLVEDGREKVRQR